MKNRITAWHLFASLRARLMALVLLAVVPALGLALWTNLEQRDHDMAEVRKDAVTLAHFLSNDQRELIEGTRRLLAGLARVPEVQRSDPATCGALLADVQKQYQGYTGFAVSGTDGDISCISIPSSQRINVSDTPWFRTALQSRQFAIGNYEIGRASGKPSAVLAYPVLDEAGQVQSVAFVGLDLGWLQQHLTGAQLPEGSSVVVLDRNGVVLARYPDPEGFVGQPFPDQPIVKTVLTQRNGVATVLGLDGVSRLYAFTPLGGTLETGADLVVGIPEASAFAEADNALARGLAVLGLVVLAALAAAWFMGNRLILGPIAALVGVTQRVAAGNLEARSGPPYRVGELGRLGLAFDEMVGTLEKRQQEVARATAQLEAANKELEAFSYSVAHDLRAPVRAMDGFSRILLEEYAAQTPAEVQRYLKKVRDNAQQMGHLVGDLLAFSRLGRQPLRMQSVSLTNTARQALEDLQQEREGRRLDLSIGDLPSTCGDPALLRQVFVNLLSNALKFTRSREVGRIEVGYYPDGRQEVYFVRDNGVGFDMRYADKLFGVFQRLHLAEEYEGTGVGLAIAQRVVHRHGGRIWAEGEVDKGAAFYFTLEGGVHE